MHSVIFGLWYPQKYFPVHLIHRDVGNHKAALRLVPTHSMQHNLLYDNLKNIKTLLGFAIFQS